MAVSGGNTFLSAKERFRVQVCFKNAITHPDEDRLLAELLTVHHFLADTSILWHMEQKTYACTTTWATTSTWLPEIYQRQASTPNVVKIIKFMHARFPGLKTVVETNEQGYEQALTSVDFEIPYWPVLPKFDADIGTIQVTISGMIRYTETMSNKNRLGKDGDTGKFLLWAFTAPVINPYEVTAIAVLINKSRLFIYNPHSVRGIHHCNNLYCIIAK